MSPKPYADDSHPHYTPGWLSELVVSHISRDFRGTIVDPACGAGNLLIAAAHRLGNGGAVSRDIKFLGVDVCSVAVRACSDGLIGLVDQDAVRVIKADFLDLDLQISEGRRVVVMNPPFLGYGQIPKGLRSRLHQAWGLRGRFNLSHVFVNKVIRELAPEVLVSVLPSNWHFSVRGEFRDVLASLGGDWNWENVGAAFDGVSTDVGVLIWQRERGNTRPRKPIRRVLDVAGFEVRHGVATGADSAFRVLAELGLPGGKIVQSVVGSDIDRGRATPIWMPCLTGLSDSEIVELEGDVPKFIMRQLRARSSVKSGRRRPLEYHENFAGWLQGHPKVLLPEIVSGDLRVEVDARGEKFPLHSTVSIRVPNAEVGMSLKDYLCRPRQISRLKKGCPPLSGGAFRLNVTAVRTLVAEWRASWAGAL